MINKMLVALDGSEHSNYALNYALDLADKYSPTVTLISVFHQVYIPFTEEAGIAAFEVRQKCLEERKNQHEKVLSEALEKIKKVNPNLKVSTKLVEGRPADMIVKRLRRETLTSLSWEAGDWAASKNLS